MQEWTLNIPYAWHLSHNEVKLTFILFVFLPAFMYHWFQTSALLNARSSSKARQSRLLMLVPPAMLGSRSNPRARSQQLQGLSAPPSAIGAARMFAPGRACANRLRDQNQDVTCAVCVAKRSGNLGISRSTWGSILGTSPLSATSAAGHSLNLLLSKYTLGCTPGRDLSSATCATSVSPARTI